MVKLDEEIEYSNKPTTEKVKDFFKSKFSKKDKNDGNKN